MTETAEGNTETGNWYDVLGETAASWQEVTTSENMEGFMGQMANMKSLMGNSIRIPSDQAGEDDWSKFNEKLMSKVPGLMKMPDLADNEAMGLLFNKIGRPEDHEGYESISDMPDLRQIAHDAGLTKKQYEIMMKAAQGNQNDILDQAKDGVLKSQLELKNKWGEAYSQRTMAIGKLIEQTDAPQQIKEMALNGTLDGNISEWLYGIVKQFGGEEQIIGEVSNSNKLDPGEAQERADEIYTRLMNEKIPPEEYQRLVHKRISLIKAANAGKR